jgi:hypothetical protein
MSGGMVRLATAAILCAAQPGIAQPAMMSTRPDPAADERWKAAWGSRAEQFDSIDRIHPTDEDKLWAMRTLRAEAAFLQRQFTRTGEPLGEAYGTYYIDLALFVTHLHDARSIDALALATDIAPAVSTTLAELGDPAVDPVIATLSNPYLRESAAFTLGKFLQGEREGRSRISGANVQKIRDALRAAVMSEVPSLQKNAIRALGRGELSREDVAILRRVAASPNTSEAVRREIERLLTR